jgi:hypothetical protein
MYGEKRKVYKKFEQFKIKQMRDRWEDNMNSHFVCLRIRSVVGCYEHDLLGSIEAGNFFIEILSVRGLYVDYRYY